MVRWLVLQRYEAYGWHVQVVDDVNNLDAVMAAIEAAKATTDKPSLIKVRGWASEPPSLFCHSHLPCPAIVILKGLAV